MPIRINRFIFTIVALFVFAQVKASVEPIPFITNYNAKQYNGHSQNWCIEQDNRGYIFIGNNNGLLFYNGHAWDMVEDLRINAVRSICKDSNGKIYIGSLSEFGFIEPNQDGHLVYVSLSSKLKAAKDFTNVWSTLIINDYIYFCCAEGIYKYKGENLVQTYFPQENNTFHKFYNVDNRLVVRENGLGLLKEDGQKLEFIERSELFSDKKVDAIISTEKGKLIMTRKEGFFLWEENLSKSTFESLEKPISNEIKQADVYQAIKLKNGNIAISTLLNGVFILDKELNCVLKLNKSNGLGDNKVHYLFEDSYRNIWAALDKGISLIEYNSPIRKFDENLGLEGNVNSTIVFKNELFAATTKGLYKYIIQKQRFEIELLGDINIFNKFKVNGKEKLLIGTKKGIYLYNDSGFEYSALENTECTYACTLQDDSSSIVVGGLNFIGLLKYEKNKLASENYNYQIEGKISSIIQDNSTNTILVSSENDGVYRFEVKFNNLKLISKLSCSDRIDVGSYFLFKNDKQIYCCTNRGIYQIENNRIKKSNILDYYFNTNSRDIFRATFSKNNTLWVFFAYNNSLTTAYSSCNGNNCSYKYLDNFIGKLNKIQVNEFYFSGKDVWFSTNDGLMSYNVTDINFLNNTFNCFITNVVSRDKTIFWGNFSKSIKGKRHISKSQSIESIPSIQHFNNAITFDFSTNIFINTEDIMFQTYLENYEEGFGEWTKDHKKSYTNLSGGKYVFHVRAKDSNENVSEETTYTFFVEYPWYQTSWGIALIVILSISFIGSVTFQYTRIKTKRIEAEKKVLEDKVTERTQELELSNQEIISQKNNLEVKNKEIDHKNKEITQSIEYALHIQQSILPDTAAIYKVLTDSFVLYKPKDIVSGDFFAFTTISQAGQQDEIIIAAADCTGHGVPGALMSMLGSNILYQIVNEKKQTTPSDILYHLNVGVNESLKQNINEGNDGMDIVLCNIKYSNDFDSAEVQYAGANRPLYIVRDGMLEEIKATKMPIGGVQFQERIFTNHQMTLKKGDILFLTTDGYADQFGGELGKKLTTKKFKEFIVTLQDKPMKEQGKRVESFFDSWRGDNEQIDDVCIIGIRI